MTVDEVVTKLSTLGSPRNVEGMARFGITTGRAFGVPTPVLKEFAREVKKSTEERHALAQQLWETGIYDARAVPL